MHLAFVTSKGKWPLCGLFELQVWRDMCCSTQHIHFFECADLCAPDFSPCGLHSTYSQYMYLLTVSFIQKMEADVDGMMQVRSCAISNVHLLSLSTPISLYHLCFQVYSHWVECWSWKVATRWNDFCKWCSWFIDLHVCELIFLCVLLLLCQFCLPLITEVNLYQVEGGTPIHN